MTPRDDRPEATPPPLTLTAPPGHRRFPLCDALRGLAAMAILVFHCGRELNVRRDAWWGVLVDRLEFGVPVFFLLSAFLLYRPFVVARHGGRAVGLQRYARRRVLRIVPAYWVALTALAVWPGLIGVLTGEWWRFYGFAQIYSERTRLQGISPAWSLDVEVAFYLLLVGYVLAVRRVLAARPRPRALEAEMAVLASILVFVSAVRVVPPLTRVADAAHLHALLVFLPRTFDWFLYGLILALASVRWAPDALPRPLAWLVAHPTACWLTAIAGFVGVAFLTSSGDRELQHVWFGPIAMLVLVPAAFDEVRGLPQRVLAWRALASLGLVSYGVFLWHQPLIAPIHDVLGGGFVTLVAATGVVAVLIGWLSFNLVEKPFMSMRSGPHRAAGQTASAGPASTAP